MSSSIARAGPAPRPVHPVHQLTHSTAWRGVGRLPNEILTAIFRFVPLSTHNADADVPLQLCLVCTRWHAIIRRDPFFWSTINVDGLKTLERIEHRLSRSGSWPLTIRVDATKRRPAAGLAFTTILETFIPHASRIRVLRLSFNQADVSALQRISFEAPMLEVLDLSITPAVAVVLKLDVHAPRVQSLRLLGFRPKSWSAVLSDCLTDINLQQGFTTSSSVLKDIMSLCPNLKSLSIAAPLLSEFCASDFEGLKPLSLDSANLILIDETVMAQILRLDAFAANSIPRISIAYPASSHSDATVSALLAGLAEVRSITLGDVHVAVTDARGFQRDLTTVRRRADEMWSFIEDLRRHGAFDTAADITLAPRGWRDLARARRLGAPALHLTLLLDPGDFFSYRFKWDPVECAHLARLTLACVDAAQETLVHPEDIDFIFGQLGQRTRDVVLERVVMAPDKDEEFNRLLTAMDARRDGL